MPKVYNKHHGNAPALTVYIGRPSKWENPYSHLPSKIAKFKVDTREEAIEAYKAYLENHPELKEAAKRELAGKDLVCWCAPLACHGDVLLEIANQ